MRRVAAPRSGTGEAARIGYNFRLLPKECLAMEAEQLNQIAASLEDLRARAADLRRYL